MTTRLLALLMLTFAAAACGDQRQPNTSYGSTTPPLERSTADNSLLADTVTPVRIGELGPAFAACNARGQPRAGAAEGPIPVRAAPYEAARQGGQLPPGSDFFICSRSLDQGWLGVIYDRSGRATAACGVSAPSPVRRDYAGPCDSGWVASAQVRLVSGVRDLPAQPSQNVGESN